MFIINVWEDNEWKYESIHTNAEAAEFYRIEQCLIDDREREIKRLRLNV